MLIIAPITLTPEEVISNCLTELFRTTDAPEKDSDGGNKWAPLKTLFWRSARSFTPTFAYKNLEIHPVFLRFLTQNLKRNFWAPAQNLVFRGTQL